jgi:hypothetical protein
MRFLIDECLSVQLVAVAGEAGHEAHHVAHVGKAGGLEGLERIASCTRAGFHSGHEQCRRFPQALGGAAAP